MSLRIYDTMRREKVAFEPLDPDHVRVYVCGPTVYDYAHIGNARPVVVFDVLARLLRRLYPRVTYVRNITDVDDKINARAVELGEDIRALTERTAAQFHEDMAALGAQQPDVEPRATEHIAEMIAMIATLIERGCAYEADGHVLFSVASMPDYGSLSRHSREELVAGARVEVAPYKRDPADFVLWKPSTPDLPGWDSPWGRGRPGWHIECSAMSTKYLGASFDIHGGGQDLIFPHHENEIAQSRCADPGEGFARYWMHNGYLMAEGEKMSKSLGNFYTVRELLEDFPGEAIRLTLLQTHYRQPLDFTKDGLAQAKATLDRFYLALRDNAGVEATATDESGIQAALEDDLNTPLAIAALHEALSTLNKAKNDTDRAAAKGALLAGGALLGLLQQNPDSWLHWRPAGAAGVNDAEIDRLVAERIAARKRRDFATADRIRDELAAAGIQLEDKP
ncbi:MAG TPA: cysteine--tRNA ligase, partial [Alphaproteobacteria bacterium]|nr:cysteine--tRNA ligase [Alphaproteobacteria bacterium]